MVVFTRVSLIALVPLAYPFERPAAPSLVHLTEAFWSLFTDNVWVKGVLLHAINGLFISFAWTKTGSGDTITSNWYVWPIHPS